MPRFFYDYEDGYYVEDSEGEEHPHQDAAVHAAHIVARELARNKRPVHGEIILKDESGAIITRIPLREV
jgi:hypothetical protein